MGAHPGVVAFVELGGTALALKLLLALQDRLAHVGPDGVGGQDADRAQHQQDRWCRVGHFGGTGHEGRERERDGGHFCFCSVRRWLGGEEGSLLSETRSDGCRGEKRA